VPNIKKEFYVARFSIFAQLIASVFFSGANFPPFFVSVWMPVPEKSAVQRILCQISDETSSSVHLSKPSKSKRSTPECCRKHDVKNNARVKQGCRRCSRLITAERRLFELGYLNFPRDNNKSFAPRLRDSTIRRFFNYSKCFFLTRIAYRISPFLRQIEEVMTPALRVAIEASQCCWSSIKSGPKMMFLSERWRFHN
jgi:hypothetical protein